MTRMLACTTSFLLSRHGLGPADVLAELHRREGISGIDEKAARKDDRRGGRETP